MGGSSSTSNPGDLISGALAKVQPGDLINADYFNAFIDVLTDLNTRVAALEAGGVTSKTVVITSITAASFPIRVQMHITVHGANFMQPAIFNAVTVAGVPVPGNSFGFDSSGTILSFDVPAVPNLPQAGLSVPVTVTNANGSATMNIVLLPVLIVPVGRVEALYTTPPVMPVGQPNITLGQSYIFLYRITAFVTLDATYQVTPSITGAAGWTAQVLQDNADVPTDGTVQLAGNAAGTPKDVRIRVTLPGGGGAGTLNVSATSPGNLQVNPGNASPITITPGAPPPTPEIRVRISLRSPAAGANGRVIFPRNAQTSVGFTVSVTQKGTYVVAAAMRSPTGWTSGGMDIPQFNVANDPAQGTTANQNINVIFTAGAAAADTDLVFTVTRAADINVQYALPVSAQ
jgi:hypothetical protein